MKAGKCDINKNCFEISNISQENEIHNYDKDNKNNFPFALTQKRFYFHF
jgi:hypothetical protein